MLELDLHNLLKSVIWIKVQKHKDSLHIFLKQIIAMYDTGVTIRMSKVQRKNM